jgi:hypothetical protein
MLPRSDGDEQAAPRLKAIRNAQHKPRPRPFIDRKLTDIKDSRRAELEMSVAQMYFLA